MSDQIRIQKYLLVGHGLVAGGKGYETVRATLQELEAKERDIYKGIERLVPGYALMANPEPLTIAEASALLLPDEALLVISSAADVTCGWLITPKPFGFRCKDLPRDELEALVTALRKGLDPTEGGLRSVRSAITLDEFAESSKGFDLQAAHRLYMALPLIDNPIVRDVRHLLIVPDGPLTALPFQVLLTQAPDGGLTGAAAYRNAPWLIRRHALTVIPSVAGLKSLRSLPPQSRADSPFIGFGDPAFGHCSDAGADRVADVRGDAPEPSAAIRVASLRSNPAARARLCALDPLPDSGDELRVVAKALGAPDNAIRLRSEASEAAVKHTALERYRIVHFATHAFVAGQPLPLSEPSLALTPPAAPSARGRRLLDRPGSDAASP